MFGAPPNPRGLQSRSRTVTLGNGTSAPSTAENVIHWECGERPSWLLIDLESTDAFPFDAELVFRRGAGGAKSVTISVGSGQQVSLFARSLQVNLANLAIESGGADNEVTVRVQPTEMAISSPPAERVIPFTWPSTGATVTNLAIPAYAYRWRLDLTGTPVSPVPAPYVTAAMAVAGSKGAQFYRERAVVTLADGSTGWQSVGGAAVIQIQPGAAGTADRFCRVVYELSL